ncbi:hypothetical protein J7E26_13235 [Bacillus sp. ISL-51]|nr:hypothetical protein [Bacillus sp. ISL-51]
MLKTQLPSSEQSPMTVMLEKLNKHHHQTGGELKKNAQNDQIEQDIGCQRKHPDRPPKRSRRSSEG